MPRQNNAKLASEKSYEAVTSEKTSAETLHAQKNQKNS